MFAERASWDIVRPSVGFIDGFSCKSKSNNNPGRAQHKHCILGKTDAETAVTWGYMQEYIHIHKPRFCVAENVEQLREDGGEDSDLAQVLAWFSKEGYFAKDFTICAENYGSLAVRKRLFVVALLTTENPIQVRR